MGQDPKSNEGRPKVMARKIDVKLILELRAAKMSRNMIAETSVNNLPSGAELRTGGSQ
jgi:hypothetical protein